MLLGIFDLTIFLGAPIPTDLDDVMVFLYDDGDSKTGEIASWKNIYNNDKLSCADKMDAAVKFGNEDVRFFI
jgi:hypothetical protein